MRLTQILAVMNGDVKPSSREPLSHYDPILSSLENQTESLPLFDALGLTSFINEGAEEILV